MSLFNQIMIRIDSTHGEQYWPCVLRYQPDTIPEMMEIAHRLSEMQTTYHGIELVCDAAQQFEIRQPHTIESLLYVAEIILDASTKPSFSFRNMVKEDVMKALREDIAWFKERGYEPQLHHIYEDGPWTN